MYICLVYILPRISIPNMFCFVFIPLQYIHTFFIKLKNIHTPTHTHT